MLTLFFSLVSSLSKAVEPVLAAAASVPALAAGQGPREVPALPPRRFGAFSDHPRSTARSQPKEAPRTCELVPHQRSPTKALPHDTTERSPTNHISFLPHLTATNTPPSLPFSHPFPPLIYNGRRRCPPSSLRRPLQAEADGAQLLPPLRSRDLALLRLGESHPLKIDARTRSGLGLPAIPVLPPSDASS